MNARRAIHLAAIAALALAGAIDAAPAGAHGRAGARHSNDPRHTIGRGTSTNWSGYDVTGSNATHAIGTWTQPAATCATGENSWSSPWVGIDGDTSNTVEQIGTDTDCRNGSPYYYAWYEMYPKSLVTIPSVAVIAGDSYTAEVTYAAGGFTLKLTDNSRAGQSFQTTQFSRKAHLASVEWIMEGASSGSLTNFGTVSFSGASATINNQTGSLASFPTADPLTMVTSQGAPRAVPSSPPSGGSFSVNWVHS